MKTMLFYKCAKLVKITFFDGDVCVVVSFLFDESIRTRKKSCVPQLVFHKI